MTEQITFIIPTRNNLPYLKLCYYSITYYAPTHLIQILDDNSNDGTKEWVESLTDKNLTYSFHINSDVEPTGHTVLYNVGFVNAATNVCCVLHADMIIGPNFVENLLKHLKPKTVVSATRIEPPLHPAGKEKIINDFGIYPDQFQLIPFDNFVINEQKNIISQLSFGIFLSFHFQVII